jgi:hypothetical protein
MMQANAALSSDDGNAKSGNDALELGEEYDEDDEGDDGQELDQDGEGDLEEDGESPSNRAQMPQNLQKAKRNSDPYHLDNK